MQMRVNEWKRTNYARYFTYLRSNGPFRSFFLFLHVLIFCGHCSFGLFFSYQRSYAFSDDYSHLNRHLGVYQRRCYFTYLRSNRLFRTFLNCCTSFLLICIVFFLSTFISTRFSPFLTHLHRQFVIWAVRYLRSHFSAFWHVYTHLHRHLAFICSVPLIFRAFARYSTACL